MATHTETITYDYGKFKFMAYQPGKALNKHEIKWDDPDLDAKSLKVFNKKMAALIAKEIKAELKAVKSITDQLKVFDTKIGAKKVTKKEQDALIEMANSSIESREKGRTAIWKTIVEKCARAALAAVSKAIDWAKTKAKLKIGAKIVGWCILIVAAAAIAIAGVVLTGGGAALPIAAVVVGTLVKGKSLFTKVRSLYQSNRNSATALKKATSNYRAAMKDMRSIIENQKANLEDTKAQMLLANKQYEMAKRESLALESMNHDKSLAQYKKLKAAMEEYKRKSAAAETQYKQAHAKLDEVHALTANLDLADLSDKCLAESSKYWGYVSEVLDIADTILGSADSMNTTMEKVNAGKA